MELVLFYITQSRELLIAFLILMFVIGLMCFLAMKNFKQDNKWKVVFYGLFLQMTNLDIAKISIMIVKSFIVFYGICVSDKTKVYIAIIMITILSMLYIIIHIKRLIHETICSIIQIIGIYFVNILKNYIKEVENSIMVEIILIFSIVAIIVFSIYLFFKEIDLITNSRANKNTKKQMEGLE